MLHSDRPLLVVLADTGETRDGLPRLVPHDNPEPVSRVMTRGLSGHLLRVFRWGQTYLERQDGIQPEPAYLLLSGNEGGFARTGFYLDGEEKRGTGYVDLHRGMTLSGELGALDQIFPHELAHLLVQQFAGPRRPGGSTQVHAVGVRTDPEMALNEGFAEHFQVMAVDDPDAEADTAFLASGTAQHRQAEEQALLYAAELLNGPTSSPGLQARFPWWFSQAERVLRYCAVKRNGFGYEPREVGELIDKGAYWEAYLVSNIVPGRPGDRAKLARTLAQTEGVIASLFSQWAATSGIRDTYCEDRFYGMFGAERGEVSPVENVYLKLLRAFHISKAQDTYTLISVYRSEFPSEATSVDAVVDEITAGQGLRAVPQFWMANTEFPVGTSVFDQFRVVPRAHTFDLNAASMLDLMTIPGVAREIASAILEGAPYSAVEDISRVPSVTSGLRERFAQMASAANAGRPDPESIEMDLLKNFGTILKSYGARAHG